MVGFRQSGCIGEKSGCNRANVAVFGQKWMCSGKVKYSGKNVFIRTKWLYSGKSGCIQAKWLYSSKSGCIQVKVDVFWQSGCFRAKVVVFGQKLLYTGKKFAFEQNFVVFRENGNTRAKCLNSGKSVCVLAK